jgi:hypothetical protein
VAVVVVLSAGDAVVGTVVGVLDGFRESWHAATVVARQMRTQRRTHADSIYEVSPVRTESGRRPPKSQFRRNIEMSA